jgi:hypothetical protein
MATGKTNSKHIRVYVDDSGGSARDISASVGDVTGTGLSYNETDVTAFSDGVVNFTLGHPTSEITITGPVNNTATTGAHIVFAGIQGKEVDAGSAWTATVTVQIGIKAAPASGDPEFEGEYICAEYVINGDGTYSARMVPGSSVAPAWGTVA